MKRSTDRILTTHTGSLPRPDDLVGMLEGHDQREARRRSGASSSASPRPSRRSSRSRSQAGVDRRQRRRDEQGRLLHLPDRSGDRLLGAEPARSPRQVEAGDFPEFYAGARASPADDQAAGLRRADRVARRCPGPDATSTTSRPRCTASNVAEAFMTAASPGVVWQFLENEYYPTHEAYVFAVADAMQHEYEAIHRGRLRAPARLPGTGDGLESVQLRRCHHRRLPQGRRAARRGAEPRHRRHPGRSGPAAPLLGQLRGAARPRHPARRASSTSC